MIFSLHFYFYVYFFYGQASRAEAWGSILAQMACRCITHIHIHILVHPWGYFESPDHLLFSCMLGGTPLGDIQETYVVTERMWNSNRRPPENLRGSGATHISPWYPNKWLNKEKMCELNKYLINPFSFLVCQCYWRIDVTQDTIREALMWWYLSDHKRLILFFQHFHSRC